MDAKVGVLTMAMLAVVVVAAVIVGIAMSGPTAAEIDEEREEVVKDLLLATTICGEDEIGYFRPAVYNPLNSTGTEYLSAIMRVYQMVGEEEVFYGTVTTNTSGVVARAATGSLAITCVANGEKVEYVAYVEASDASITSERIEFTAAEDVVKEISVPQQAALIFRVYDNDNKGYVYGGAAASSSTWMAAGSTFYSTTSNSTGTTIGTDGSFDYTLYVKTNATAATDTQYEDQALYLYTNIDDLSDWNELGIDVDGALTSIDFPNSKIANSGYDFAYELEDVHIGTAQLDVDITGQALSGQNPSDDAVIAFGTSGYVKQTIGSGMILDTNKDDSAKTTVYTIQTATFDFV